MTIRTAFEKRFGVADAEAIWQAALRHANGINDGNKGDDPFKWAILICIGYQCMEVPGYRDEHEITAS